MSRRIESAEATAIRNRFVDTFRKAVRMKTKMKAKKLKVAKAKCPYCEEGYWYARLVGPKEHFHMSCNKCDTRMME